ncbi:alpha/beta fold hydrolase [Deinococcus metallilatus]|uniref:Alpha/beta fold hydrolase n=1 Tax=Deinococcus metallilatus TaxID=1211322 RepID=A0AAJ5F527_9DEIO|nr:alpha/beta fold hydrolase [Deinococcus metallilatus]MBB5295580.1 pimeloyl-ACP methyl ester carboxylesterase [Deinococcus metallilatus]QBY07910.1 alpha/beta fold hydrolase [Deinococcus metallilatus]RXJ12803.1 alpha/beta fold hydrolase [Deinococcus metallilatus]TLK27275.1 alpha/beta fold hydrolase [Deinococcus metallilatus]GMA16259.1 epoxide hydrolase [Deinococcus metallilatus]
MADLAGRELVVNGVRLHVVEAGPVDGPLVVLLHGFPEFWRAWERQIGPLARAGFRVVAPDLRGYDLSEKPPGVPAYRLSRLREDVAALIHALGYERAHVVGHDWGGIIAWALAIRQPEVVDRLVILNAPHPAAARRMLRMPRQWLRSWYILFFQLPWLPERFLLRSGRKMLRGTNPAAYTPHDRELYQRAWEQPGAATAMINYYRALPRFGNVKENEVRVPTLVLWGERDVALLPELADGLERWVPDLRVVRFPRASHWVMRDEPVRVNNLLLGFLSI